MIFSWAVELAQTFMKVRITRAYNDLVAELP